MRILDYQKVEDKLVNFIKREFKKAGFTKANLGISGGIDSSVIAYLTVKSLGVENVHGILMPYDKIRDSVILDVDDGKKICEHLGIGFSIKNITKSVDAMCELVKIDLINVTPENALRIGNISARIRMITLFDYSSANKSLVIGTENFLEHVFGYYTLFGDSASCIEPIFPLYKTEVFGLAKHVGLPQFILDKKPSARLWTGHIDEMELGISYSEADAILYYHYEQGWDIDSFKLMEWDMYKVNHVFKLIEKNKFKKYVPIKPRINILKNCEVN